MCYGIGNKSALKAKLEMLGTTREQRRATKAAAVKSAKQAELEARRMRTQGRLPFLPASGMLLLPK